MHYIEDKQLRDHFDNAFGNEDGQNYVVCLKPFSKGFFVGSNEGDMACWVRSEESQRATKNKTINFVRKWQPSAAKRNQILAMAISANEETIAVALQNNNIGLIGAKSIGFNDTVPSGEVKFDLVSRGFHSGPITGLDCAI